MSKIKVTKIRSTIGHPDSVRKVLWGLGLRRMHQTREHNDNNCIRGMINKVSHFVTYELVK